MPVAGSLSVSQTLIVLPFVLLFQLNNTIMSFALSNCKTRYSLQASLRYISHCLLWSLKTDNMLSKAKSSNLHFFCAKECSKGLQTSLWTQIAHHSPSMLYWPSLFTGLFFLIPVRTGQTQLQRAPLFACSFLGMCNLSICQSIEHFTSKWQQRRHEQPGTKD